MFLIKKLDIFIAKQFGLLFVGTFFICQFVLMMQFLWRYVDELIGKGLSLDILAQFFWYMGLMLMPQAFPLAILLSSLIAFGNLGESSELTAIKAAGISLIQSMRSLIAIVCCISCISFYFQEVVGPESFVSFRQLLMSMKQKNPEVEIPEGIFYDGVSGSNIYVQKKDLNTGKLYGLMIFRINGGYDDHAIILADSGTMQSTAEKKHILLTLYSGEWFENMRQQDIAGPANVPYRRETFSKKRILLDFDGDFNMADAGGIATDARSKGMRQILHDLDSIREFNDSVGHAVFHEAQNNYLRLPSFNKKDSLKVMADISKGQLNFDSAFTKLPVDVKQSVIKRAADNAQMAAIDLDFKADYSTYLNRNERLHEIEAINKITLSLSCLIFFFIGAPLGAIIRKGGLGVPIIISVIVYIIYFLLDNTGFRMARLGAWPVWLAKGLAPVVLIPTAVFFTYKANKDSMVFNIDLYRNFFMRLLGLRLKRSISIKEVIIEEPQYADDKTRLQTITHDIVEYNKEHRLYLMPNVINVFFRYVPDHEIERISDELESVIADLGNTRERDVMKLLQQYPVMSVKAHTRPFDRKWMNILAFLILPVGIFLYIRMWMFRLRLLGDLRTIHNLNDGVIQRIDTLLYIAEQTQDDAI